jgi:hypothetical protein
MSNIFISIQLNSNRPKNLVDLLDNLEKTTTQPSNIEVIVHFDLSDHKTKDVLQYESNNRKVKIKYISSDLVKDYGTLWKPLNLILKETDNNAYFILNISDEIRFKTFGWDQELIKYKNYYQDNIFRLRLSKYKYRNYFDFWESGFAPDSICFYTKKWMELSGDWNPCLGPDSFQQSIAYYLMKSDRFSPNQINRDIAVNNINIVGEGAGRGDDELSHYRLIKTCTKAWFILMSHEFQEEAKRRAMRMKAHILSIKYQSDYIEDRNKKKYYFINTDIKSISYSICKPCISIINLFRMPSYLYYAGGGGESNSRLTALIFILACHSYKGEYIIYNYLQTKKLINKIILKIISNNKKIFVTAKKIINNLLKHRIKSDHINNQILNLFNSILIKDVLLDKTRLSILVTTNNIKNIKALISNLETTASEIESIELVIRIDGANNEIKDFLDFIKDKVKLQIKFFSDHYSTDWKKESNEYSKFLKIVSKNSDFITMISDDLRFKSKSWDLAISDYNNFYDDDIFRIKLAKNKYFNYSDEWECGFATNGITFYSRNWLVLQDLNSQYTGSEIFQSLVSYYMMIARKFSHNQYYRDIVDPFLFFSGERAMAGIHCHKNGKSAIDICKDWFRIFSYKNLSIAKKNASILVAFIEYNKLKTQKVFPSIQILDDGRSLIIADSEKILFRVFYNISNIKIFIKNIIRAPLYHYYSGGGNQLLCDNPLYGIRIIINAYFPFIAKSLGISIK